MQRWFQDFHKSFDGVFPLELIQYLQAATSQERKTVQAKLVRFQKSSSGSLVAQLCLSVGGSLPLLWTPNYWQAPAFGLRGRN